MLRLILVNILQLRSTYHNRKRLSRNEKKKRTGATEAESEVRVIVAWRIEAIIQKACLLASSFPMLALDGELEFKQCKLIVPD